MSEGEGDDFVAGDDDEVEVKEGDAATEPVAEKGKEPAKAEKGKEGDKGKEPAKKDAGKEPAKDAKKDAKKK